MKVLFLALTATRARAIKRHCHFLLEHGVEVVLVTTNPDPWEAEKLDARVQVHTLREGEGRHPLPRGERFLVFRGPRFVLARAQRAAGGRASTVAAVTRRYERGANLFHRKVFMRLYRALRPYILWRVARRDVLPGIDLTTVNEVVVGDSHAIPLAWHIARDHPALKVSFSLDRAVYADASAPADPEAEAGAEQLPEGVRRAADV
jgi:hypothetical protein